MLFFGFFLFFW